MRTARHVLVLTVAVAVAGCTGTQATTGASTASPSPAGSAPPLPAGVAAFTADDLARTQHAEGQAFSSFARSGSLEAGLYLLDPDAQDRQAAHDRDEVYAILDGSAMLVVGDSQLSVGAGSALFVRAGTEHHFEGIDDALTVVVVFVEGSSEADPPFSVIASPEDAVTGTATRWDQTLSRATVTAGLYGLPVGGGGDRPVKHEVDEINVVLAGTGTLNIEGVSVDLVPGSLVLVPAGLSHSFATPVTDMLDLIVFAGR